MFKTTICLTKYNFVFLILLSSVLYGQQTRILTYDESIQIALNKSYTAKSRLENKVAMEHSFNFYKAMFKPRLDLQIFSPSWTESVIPVQLPDGLPIYNSFGTMQFKGDLSFTYTLPTGGFLALSSEMYRNDISTVLALREFSRLRTTQAHSSFSISFNQPIFTRNTLNENLEEARYSYERSSSRFTREQLNIIYNVTQGFYSLYKATRELEIASEKLNNSQESYRIAQLKAETGRIPEGDVLIAEVQLAQDRANLSESDGNLEQVKDSFKQLIGLNLEEEFQIVTDVKYDTFSVDLNKAIKEALKNRLELNEAELDIKLQEIQVDRAKRVRELSGNISAYYDIAGVSTIGAGSIQELFESSFDNFVERPPNRGITFSLSYPIFDWGRGSQRVQQEMAGLRSVKLSRDNWRTTIVREVRQIVRSVEETKNRLKIHEKNQQVSQRSYEISLLRFENGDLTSQELAVEQERLADSRLTYLNAFITYQSAIADLKRKTLWDFKNNRSYLTDDYFKEL